MFYGYSAYTETSIVLKLILMVVLALGFDLYCQYGLNKLFKFIKNHIVKKSLVAIHWLTFLFILGILIVYFARHGARLDEPAKSRYFYFAITIWLLFYIPKIVFSFFIFLRQLVLLIRITSLRLLHKKLVSPWMKQHIYLKTGYVFSLLVFLFFLSGIIFFKQSCRVVKVDVYAKNLPVEFDGFTIGQISDLHLGSYRKKNFYRNAVNIINKLHIDILVNTGDLVNFNGMEAKHWVEIFAQLDAPYGKYSILGNHDFGDYVSNWGSTQKKASVDSLIKFQEQMGFKVLRNEHIQITKGKDSIYLTGIDNWSPSHYMKYGDFQKASQNIPESAFKILLSHDPNQWKFEVVQAKTIINLTLSGHTHGAQAGFRLGKLLWSPVKIKYDYWGGLYSQNERLLYVNTGLGSIGFLGRLGLRPEITVIRLKKDFGNVIR